MGFGHIVEEMIILTSKKPSPRGFYNTVLTTFLATDCQSDADAQFCILNSYSFIPSPLRENI